MTLTSLRVHTSCYTLVIMKLWSIRLRCRSTGPTKWCYPFSKSMLTTNTSPLRSVRTNLSHRGSSGQVRVSMWQSSWQMMTLRIVGLASSSTASQPLSMIPLSWSRMWPISSSRPNIKTCTWSETGMGMHLKWLSWVIWNCLWTTSEWEVPSSWPPIASSYRSWLMLALYSRSRLMTKEWCKTSVEESASFWSLPNLALSLTRSRPPYKMLSDSSTWPS